MSRVRPGPAPAPPDDGAAAPGSRRLVAGIVLGALAVVVVVLVREHQGSEPVAEQLTSSYVDAWNDRDAQAVSDLTCPWQPAFTPAGVVEDQFSSGQDGAPRVGDYSVIGTERGTLSGRDVVAVRLRYLRDGESRSRRATVYVRLADGEEPCLASLTTW